MEIASIQYNAKGWSCKNFPSLDSSNTLIIVFAAPEYKNNLTPINQLAEAYPKSKIIGCSTAGEIAGSTILDNSLSVAIIKFKKTVIKTVKSVIEEVKDSFEAGAIIAKQLDADDLKAIFVLSKGLNVNGTELVKGLHQKVKENTIITGGLAGDGKDFKSTWTLHGQQISDKEVVAVGFYGSQIKIGHASQGGWDIFGPERRVTSSRGNILYELDDQPALELYKEYLGDRASGLPATGLLYPLAIRQGVDSTSRLVRTILGINENDQSLIFAGDIPMGCLAQLMHANFDRLINSAGEAGEQAFKILNNNENIKLPILTIAVSCVGRRLVLGERTEEEIESVLEILPSNTTQIGFYSYGELSPYKTGLCDLHNQTMTLTLLQET